ncbi:hypothetical protein [Streptomyces virginiae]|uniref:hypothetical protein n=1 Tax=Streptomyces virginiae TaxID=1961 RepID=UPI0032491157
MTYPPQPEPFAEAAQTAAMAYRLVMTINDAVRRATRDLRLPHAKGPALAGKTRPTGCLA